MYCPHGVRLLYTTLRYTTHSSTLLRYAVLLFSTPLYANLFNSPLLFSAQLFSTLLFSTVFYFTLRDDAREGEGGRAGAKRLSHHSSTRLPAFLSHFPPPLGQNLSKVAWEAVGDTTKEAGGKRSSASIAVYIIYAATE